jgi:hypothetical protein
VRSAIVAVTLAAVLALYMVWRARRLLDRLGPLEQPVAGDVRACDPQLPGLRRTP